MPDDTLIFDERKRLAASSAEETFRSIAARRLRERGCRDAEVGDAIDRLIAKPMTLDLQGE